MITEALKAAITQHFSADARADYELQLKHQAYVASEAWQYKRLQKLLSLAGIAAHSYENIDWLVQQASRHLYSCETCGSRGSQAEVQVHHRTYRNLGREPLDDLVILCGFCHQALHKVAHTTGLSVEIVSGLLLGRRQEPPPDQAIEGAPRLAYANYVPPR